MNDSFAKVLYYFVFSKLFGSFFIMEFCNQLPRYKRPHKIIFANVPRNPTGKIEKPRLRELYGGASLVAKQNRS